MEVSSHFSALNVHTIMKMEERKPTEKTFFLLPTAQSISKPSDLNNVIIITLQKLKL
jgi:hypothetical protein